MMHGNGCTPSKIAKVLLVIGGLNWGLVGIGMLMHANWNVVNLIFGSWPVVETIIYLLVGVGAIANIFHCKCAKCMAACGADKKM